jgi:hypothetical protein
MSLRDHADDYLRAYVGPLAALHHALSQGQPLSTTLPCLVSIIQHVADMRAPSLDGHAPPAEGWWDAACLAAKQAAREAYGSFLRLKRLAGVDAPATAAAQAHVNRLRSAYRSLRRRKKYEWGAKREEALMHMSITNPQRFWRSVCGTVRQQLPIQDLSVWTSHFGGVLAPPQEALAFGGAHDPFQNEQHRQDMKKNLVQLPQRSRLQQQQRQHPAYMEALNAEVTCGEVDYCLSLLHRGRMADADGLTAEALQYCWMGWRGKTDMDASPSPACQIFRECLRGVLQQMWTEEWPDRLCTSSLVPIPKGAATTNPGQYRGIAGSHIITKLHELILFERADRVSEQHNLRSPTQCGFRKGKGTLDATFTLQHLVARARHQKKRLYVTFVDFEKAFDMVPRDELLARCERLGVHGAFLAAIRQVYNKVLYRVSCEGEEGPAIQSTRGTKQGSHLSPLLFGWFIEQLHDLLLKRVRAGIHTLRKDALIQLGEGDQSMTIADILYADDCALISSIPALMQDMLDYLSRFCDMFGMRVHPTKTQWIEFRRRKAPPQADVTFSYRGVVLPRVEECTYMGLWWHATKDIWESHVPQAKIRGMRTLYGFQSRCRALHISIPRCRSWLFSTLVAPSFSHACQLWCVGGSKQLLRKVHLYPLEAVQLSFLRNMAGVGSSSHVLSLLLEFGHSPLLCSHLKLAARFWDKMQSSKESSMLYQAWYSDLTLAVHPSQPYAHTWCFQFLYTMAQLGLCDPPTALTLEVACALSFPEDAVVVRLQRLALDFICPPAEDIPKCPRFCLSDQVTAFTYRYWVGMSEAQKYGGHHASCLMPHAQRHALVRLRLGCSDLAVVQGRRSGVARHARLCKVHNMFDSTHACVEDIRHFLLECPAYEGIRLHPYFTELFSCLRYEPNNLHLTTSEMVRKILSHPNQSKLALCISRMFSLRTHILQGTGHASGTHADMPSPQVVARSWWLLGANEDLSLDTF